MKVIRSNKQKAAFICCLPYSDVWKQKTKGMRNEDKTFTATLKLHEDLQQTPT